ncbi:MAG: N-acetylmuramic acid 6-phosphate etherase [Vicinamibacterales bacterium]
MTDKPALPITEQDNPRTHDLSSRSVMEILGVINDEDTGVPAAVGRELPAIGRAVEAIVDRLRRGGRLFYVGCGTSGRLGVLDASECPPTFGVARELIQGVIAGGYDACHRAVEASEDDRAAGGRDLATHGVDAADAVIGLAASGRTPYTIGAVEHARRLGAFTAAVTCAPGSEITGVAEVSIVPVVGPEVLTGSSRMKAGTAQKLVLNMISTAVMIRLGYVAGNRMSNMRPANEKLRERSLRVISAETGVGEDAARAALERAGGDLPLTLVMLKSGRSLEDARDALAATHAVVSDAVARLTRS